MRTLRPLWIVLLLGLCATRDAVAAEPAPPTGRDIIVGTVKSVSGGDGTNGDPPRAIFEITETLKGDLKGTIKVAWKEAPPGFGSDDPSKGPDGWADQKVENPKVGDSYILFGRLNTPVGRSVGHDGREPLWFYTTPGGRMTLTAENRDKALQAIKFYEDKAKADVERRAAEAARTDARHTEAVQRFRTPMADEKLTAAVQSADFVALARFGGGDSGTCSFQVTEVLKGRKRLTPPPKDTGPSVHDYSNWVRFDVPRDVAAALSPAPGQAALEAPPLYVVMLSEKGLVATCYGLRYQTVQPARAGGDHVAFAADATVKRVRELTQGLAGKGPPAVLINGDNTKFLDALDAAADGKVVFARICLGWGFDALDKATVSRSLDVDFLMQVTRKSASGASDKPSFKLELAKRGQPKTILMDMTVAEVDEKSCAAQAAAVVAAILTASR